MTEARSTSAQPAAGEAESAAAGTEVVTVDIYDQMYRLRGSDPAQIARLAAVVDGKMRAVAAHGGSVDSLRVAVLAAINLADELASLRSRYDALAASVRQSQTAVRSRAGDLSEMLDEVLGERRAG